MAVNFLLSYVVTWSVCVQASGYGSGCVCVCECRYFRFCVSPILWVYVCVREGWVCVFLFVCVYPSVFSCVCLCLVSVCLMCWILSMLLSVPVFMQPMIVCIYASQLYMCIPVSMLSYRSCLPVLKGVQRSHYVVHFPSVWHVPAVHRQVIDCVCFLYAGDWLCLFLLCCLEQSGPRRSPGVLGEPEGCFVNKEGKQLQGEGK